MTAVSLPTDFEGVISFEVHVQLRGVEECMLRVAHAYERATARHKEKPPL